MLKLAHHFDMPSFLKSEDWEIFLNESFKTLITMEPVPYSDVTPSKIVSSGGVYLITELHEVTESALYVGKSGDLVERIYRNHLMGNIRSSNLKRYLINDSRRVDLVDAQSVKEFLRAVGFVRWVLEPNPRKRGAIECYCIARLFPTYGITEEH